MPNKKKTRQEKTRFSSKHIILIPIIISLITALSFTIYFLFSQSEAKFSLNAAIIDQLKIEYQNQAFIDNVTSLLEKYGFQVTYYKTARVDVYRELAKKDYGIIILRVHSALREDKSTVDLFTSERYSPYDPDKYRWERENDYMVIGELLYRPGQFYYAVTHKFIQNLEGRFSKSIIVAMGCWSLKEGCEQLAKAFVDKGAIAYIGWTNIVLINHTDTETMKLLTMLLDQNYSVSKAVSKTQNYSYIDAKTGEKIETKMRFYPAREDIANLKISDLIAETKTTLNSNFLLNYLPYDILLLATFPSKYHFWNHKNDIFLKYSICCTSNSYIKCCSIKINLSSYIELNYRR
ncbi:hypothetical protein DRO69_02345 [Candidatus Bathyarchaeota archaeon]|nr:MAG: hypothetical protein DRO69_02345 [Candidatus Bathyarchaeota archaeon]